ncbi:hypothetical protein ACFVJM_31000 [Streptomyces virginiae]|uniref:hypothetical protein n=1 Tax=Streptomyces virginiae TaxID=1961 RepID=UPI0036281C82
MTTTTTRPGLAAADDPWMARKMMEAGFGGADCDFPDCTNGRAPRPKGKPGPPPKFCVQHNNPRDRQLAYRARKALEKERAAAPEPVPVQQAVAQGAREQQVLTTLLPRVLTALEAVHQGQQAGADTAAVAAHIAEVNSAADERVRQAEEQREEAARDAGQAREEAARSKQAAADAHAEQQAAQMEAATALREAAAADARATAAGVALDTLSDTHRQLRDSHHELIGKHEELSKRHQELERTLAALASEHGTLRTEHGRLQGEAQTLHVRVKELSGEKARIEESQRSTAADLARAQSENTGLAARLDELEAHREELRETIGRQNTRLDDERAQHRDGLAALRAQLEAARAKAEPNSAAGHGAGPAPAAGTEPADGDDQDAESAGDGREAPVAIVDLGVHGGAAWTLVHYEDDHSGWRVLRDGEIAGGIQPEHSLHGTSLLGWSARTSLAMPLRPPHGQRHFANREQAAGAVVRDGLRRPSGTAAAVADVFTALGEPEQNALVAAVVPLATATPERGGRLARLPQAVRDAALRTALRVPGEQDIQQLTALDAAELGRSKEARQLLRALQDLAPADPGETGPVDLGTFSGRAWRLEPDPAYLGGYRVLADGTEVGAVAPVRRSKSDIVRWTAEHRRRPLGRGPSHSGRDTAAHAVIAAEDVWVPLPAVDDETYLRIPAALRSNLYGAASRIDLRRGRLAQIQPGAYRQQLHAAIGQAGRTDTGRIRGQHLAILLDAAREDLGAAGSAPAQRLYEALQQIRVTLLSGEGSFT